MAQFKTHKCEIVCPVFERRGSQFCGFISTPQGRRAEKKEKDSHHVWSRRMRGDCVSSALINPKIFGSESHILECRREAGIPFSLSLLASHRLRLNLKTLKEPSYSKQRHTLTKIFPIMYILPNSWREINKWCSIIIFHLPGGPSPSYCVRYIPGETTGEMWNWSLSWKSYSQQKHTPTKHLDAAACSGALEKWDELQ